MNHARHAGRVLESSVRAEAHRRQRFDLVLGEVDPYLVAHSICRPDRYCNLLAPPHVTLLKDHVRDVMIGRVDHNTLYRADQAICGMHSVAATYLHLAD